MNIPQREETARGRRRRRRPPPPNTTADSEAPNTPFNRTGRRHQSNPSNSHRISRQEASSEKSPQPAATSQSPGPSDACISPIRHTLAHNKPISKNSPQETSPEQNSLKHAAIDKQLLEKNAQIAREEEEKQRRLEAQSAKRSAERDRNLLFLGTTQPGSIRKERPSDSELRQLDSSLKKCTGFLRKIRSSGVTVESVSTLCNEARNLNLSRYISEVVAAITESKLKSSDIEYVILLCGEMHRRYEEFPLQLVTSLSNVITTSAPVGGAIRDMTSRKAAMRLMVEIFVLGMMADINPLTSVLKHLMKASKESMDNAVVSLGILATFARYANRTLLPPRVETSQTDSARLKTSTPRYLSWEDDVLPEGAKRNIFSALESFFTSDIGRIVKEADSSLRKASETHHRFVQMRGSPDEASTQAFETAKQLCEKVISSANILAQQIGKPIIELPVYELQSIVTQGDGGGNQENVHVIVSNPMNSLTKIRQSASEIDIMMQADNPFEGEQQRSFYTELLPAKSLPEKIRDSSLESISGKGYTSSSRDGKGVQKASSSPSKATLSQDEKSSAGGKTGNECKRKSSEKQPSIEKLLSRLTTIESKEDADSFVCQFIASTEGLKNGTKRLGKTLLSVSAQKLNLLPSYSRIAATLQPIYPDMVATIANMLEEEFRFLVSKPDVDEKTLSTCIKNSQYVGEFVKFDLISSLTMFDMLALCMKDLSGHRVDLACHLLESCGRYIYLSPSTHIRMANILETLWRLKSVKNLEARHNTLIETAFFAVRLSPGSKAHRKKSRPPLHEYIRHLIYNRLDATNISWTHSQLLKLPWSDEIEAYVVNKFVKISRARFSTIPYAAALLGSLQKDKPYLVIAVIDSLIEAVRAGMEKNDGRESQRRIAEMHLIGEMHTCGIVDERVIYNILYQFITLGHEDSDRTQGRSKTSVGSTSIQQDSNRNGNEKPPISTKNGTFTSAPDPPGDFFRVRLACSLLESCGRVLAVANRRKLEVFWFFIERYIFCKAYQAGQGDILPLHVNHLVGDVFESVLSKPKRVGKESRGHFMKSVDGKTYHTSVKSSDGRIYGRTIMRSRNLEEAARAVMLVERSSADTALISIPLRRVELAEEPKVEPNGELIGSRFLTTALPNPAPGSGIRGNVRDGFVTTNTRPKSPGLKPIPAPTGSDLNTQSQAGSLPGFALSDESNGEEEVLSGAEESEEDGTPDSDGEYEESLDEDTDDEEDEESDDDVCPERQRPRTEEEDAFAKELAAFTAAAVQDARTSTSRVTKFDRMAIPMALMTQKMEEEKAARAAAAAEAANSGNLDDSSEDDGESRANGEHRHDKPVEFKMLVRKGGKSQLQGLQVPSTSSLAVAAKESETADAVRSEETKRLVLGSTIVLNDESDDLDDEVPLRFQQDAREKEKSIRQQRVEDEKELLSTLFRGRPRR